MSAAANNTRIGRAGSLAHGRHYAVAHEGTKITLECPNGHRYTEDYSKKPVSKRLDAGGVAMMARWWSRERGGCSARCKRCEREMAR